MGLALEYLNRVQPLVAEAQELLSRLEAEDFLRELETEEELPPICCQISGSVVPRDGDEVVAPWELVG